MCLFVTLISTQPSIAVQLAPRIQIFDRRAPAIVQDQDQALAEAEALAKEERELDYATLKTDPDLEATMEKAERYMGDGNYQTASTLWQAVLHKSGDALYSDDDETYRSMVQRVEKLVILYAWQTVEVVDAIVDQCLHSDLSLIHI